MSRRHPESEPEQPVTAAADPDSTHPRIEPTGTAVAPSQPADSEPAATPPPSASHAKPSQAPRQTLAGRVWVFLAVAAILLVLVIIFIAENTKSITISFLGAHGHISEALALLLAVVVGIVICLLVGSARILQLSLEVRRQKKTVQKLS